MIPPVYTGDFIYLTRGTTITTVCAAPHNMLQLLGQLALVICYHVLAVAGVQQPLFCFYLFTRTQGPGGQEVC
jgi:hypothetical protein